MRIVFPDGHKGRTDASTLGATHTRIQLRKQHLAHPHLSPSHSLAPQKMKESFDAADKAKQVSSRNTIPPFRPWGRPLT